jgi:arsenite/tail-anchored protein-transporting ATPase
VLSIELPFTEALELDLTRNSDELFVAVGPHRRNLLLPDSLRRREIASAAVADGRLAIRFAATPVVPA